jgi:hypothetical protein
MIIPSRYPHNNNITSQNTTSYCPVRAKAAMALEKHHEMIVVGTIM